MANRTIVINPKQIKIVAQLALKKANISLHLQYLGCRTGFGVAFQQAALTIAGTEQQIDDQ